MTAPTPADGSVAGFDPDRVRRFMPIAIERMRERYNPRHEADLKELALEYARITTFRHCPELDGKLVPFTQAVPVRGHGFAIVDADDRRAA